MIALAANAILVAILIPFVWLFTRWLPYPSIKHWCWLGLLIKLLLPYMLFLPGMTVTVRLSEYVPVDFASPSIHWSTVLLGGMWLAGFVVTLVRTLRRSEIFRRYVSRKGASHAPADDLAQRVDPGGWLFPTPPVALVDAVHSPMLCGVGPYCQIMFPRDLWHALPISGRASLLAHELAHFRRGDAWVRCVELVAAVIYWWFPGLWIIKYYLEQSEEDHCDAIAAGQDPTAYAEAMVTTFDFLAEPQIFRPAVADFFLAMRSSIERRLHRILEVPSDLRVPPIWYWMLAVYYLVLLLLSLRIA